MTACFLLALSLGLNWAEIGFAARVPGGTPPTATSLRPFEPDDAPARALGPPATDQRGKAGGASGRRGDELQVWRERIELLERAAARDPQQARLRETALALERHLNRAEKLLETGGSRRALERELATMARLYGRATTIPGKPAR